MAVKRIWFPDIPSGTVDINQRSQIAVGYVSLTAPTPPPPATFTRLNLQTRVQNFLNCPVYFTPTDLNPSIQDGLDEVCAFTGCIYKSASIPFVPNLTYYDMISLLPDYIGVIAIWNTSIKRWMTVTSVRKLDQDRIDWETALGVPYYFIPINHRYIAIYKKPATSNYGNMYIFYRAAGPTLDDSLQIPLPDDHMYSLEAYVLTDMLEQNQEFDKAMMMFQSYTSNLEEFRKYIQEKRLPARLPSLR